MASLNPGFRTFSPRARKRSRLVFCSFSKKWTQHFLRNRLEPLWLFVASGRHLLRNLNHVKTNSFDSKHIDSLFPSFLSAGKVVAVMHGANAPMMKARTSANLFNIRSDLQKSCHWRCGHQNSGHKVWSSEKGDGGRGGGQRAGSSGGAETEKGGTVAGE